MRTHDLESTGQAEDDGPGDGHASDLVSGFLPVPSLACATCSALLGDDPEDEPDGDAGLPICGECNRARNFDLIRFDEEVG